jgi:hypothetical protein
MRISEEISDKLKDIEPLLRQIKNDSDCDKIYSHLRYLIDIIHTNYCIMYDTLSDNQKRLINGMKTKLFNRIELANEINMSPTVAQENLMILMEMGIITRFRTFRKGKREYLYKLIRDDVKTKLSVE